MKPRIRTYDLITIVGVLVVLAWTPVYLAEGGAPEAPSAGHSFVLPDIRYGDRIEYELILKTSDEPAVSSGPFITLTFREPEQGEGPEGTVLVAALHNPPLKTDFGPAILTQNEHDLVHYVNATGAIIGGTSTSHRLHPADGATTSGLPLESRRLVPAVQHSEPPEGRGLMFFQLPVRDKVEYDPVDPWSALADLVAGEWEPQPFSESQHPVAAPMAQPAPTQTDHAEPAPFAAVHRERVLYATDLFATPTRPSWRGPEIFSGFRVFDIRLEWKNEDLTATATQAWKWWAEDLPVQAGEHKSFYDRADAQAKRIATLDLVPAVFRSGHTPVPLDGPGIDPEPPEPRLTGFPTFDDTAALVGERSLSDMRDDLTGGRSPKAVQTLMDEDPTFVGILWERTPAADTLFLAMLFENTTYAVRLHYTDGEVLIDDACGKAYELAASELTTDCQEYPLGVAIRTPRNGVRSPEEVLDDLRDRLADRSPPDGTEFGMYRLGLGTPIPPDQGHGQRPAEAIHAVFPLHENEDAIVGRRVPGKIAVAYGSYLYPSVGHRELIYQEGTEGIGSEQSLVPGTTATAPRLIGPFGPEPIYGGLVLLLIGAIVRLAAAVKAGAHLPLAGFFYAKITKDRVLDHKHRETMSELVSSDPGISLTEVADRMGLSRTGAYHHLETLVRNRLLHVSVVARSRHYYAPDWTNPKARVRRAVARREIWEKVLGAVEAHPGAPLHALAKRLDTGKSTVSRTGTRLAALGLVRKVRDGRETRFYPVETAPPAATPPHASSVEP